MYTKKNTCCRITVYNNQKKKNLIKKWKKELNRYFSKDKQMASKHTIRGKKIKKLHKIANASADIQKSKL